LIAVRRALVKSPRTGKFSIATGEMARIAPDSLIGASDLSQKVRATFGSDAFLAHRIYPKKCVLLLGPMLFWRIGFIPKVHATFGSDAAP
jgi:hypothetical protein